MPEALKCRLAGFIISRPRYLVVPMPQKLQNLINVHGPQLSWSHFCRFVEAFNHISIPNPCEIYNRLVLSGRRKSTLGNGNL